MKKTEKPIIVEQTFNTSIDVVWDAITNHEKMKHWFFKDIPSFKPEIGFETKFIVKSQERTFPHVWKIIEVIPNQGISYHWSYEGYSGAAFVSFELSEENNQTKLILTSTAIEDFEDNIPEFTRESGLQGWQYFIQKELKSYLDRNTNK